MRVPPALVLAIALLSGCVGQPTADSGAEYAFSGVFLATVASDEIAVLKVRALGEGGEFASDGKIPPSFVARGLTKSGCDIVRGYAATMDIFETLALCEALATAAPVIPVPANAPSGPVLASMPVR